MVDELDSAAACTQHIYARESASAWRREVAMAVEHGGRLRERGRGDCPEGKRREEKRREEGMAIDSSVSRAAVLEGGPGRMRWGGRKSKGPSMPSTMGWLVDVEATGSRKHARGRDDALWLQR